MANLGYQAVYQALNQIPGVSCERAVLPEDEDLRRLEQVEAAPVSLESESPLGSFDVLAFSITYELDYLNLLRLLADAGIPPDRNLRNCYHPVVVAGGAALTVNHLPLVPILDGWFRGEAEGRLEDWVEVLRQARLEGARGEELWTLLGAQDPEGEDATAPGLGRRFLALRSRGEPSLDFSPVGSELLHSEAAFGATALVEVCRGCPWRCSFCVARDMYGSFRRASTEEILSYARRLRSHTDRLGIIGAGLSATADLVGLLRALRGQGFRVSLSSLRLDRLREDLLEEILLHGQRTLTVAPENFSPRLQRVVQKSLSLEKIVAGLERVGPDRFHKIKLYMIAGFPGQEEEDHAIAFETARDLITRKRIRPGQLEFSFSVLLPRPGTALGQVPLLSRKAYRTTARFLERQARGSKVGLRVEGYRLSMVCDLLCRGDQEVGRQLLSWSEETRARVPFRLQEREYRRAMEGVMERWETRTPGGIRTRV
jgi:radical SAM superfamily enzyme YgiQ (UPF0313 family)